MVPRLPSAPGRSQRPSLSDEAASYVRALVMAGALLPGDFVRIEMVADALGISATPAREALQALRVEGFLRLEPRRGFVVAELRGEDIRDLFTAQALIAGELASRAAVRATDEDLRLLDAAHQAVTEAARSGDTEALEQHNDTFHRVLNRTAGTRKLAWVLGLLVRYVPRQFYGSIEGWPSATVHDHSEVVQSIRDRDGEAARRAMEAHINHAGELLARHFDERMAATRLQPKGAPDDVGAAGASPLLPQGPAQ